jgi:hypothetical protein
MKDIKNHRDKKNECKLNGFWSDRRIKNLSS